MPTRGKPEGHGLKRVVARSVSQWRGRHLAERYVLPEVSDYLLEKLLKGDREKMMKAKLVEARTFRYSVIRHKARASMSLPAGKVLSVLKDFEGIASWAIESRFFSNQKLQSGESLKEVLMKIRKDIGKDMERLERTDKESITQVGMNFINYLDLMIDLNRVKELRPLLGSKSDPYIRALNRATEIVHGKLYDGK